MCLLLGLAHLYPSLHGWPSFDSISSLQSYSKNPFFPLSIRQPCKLVVRPLWCGQEKRDREKLSHVNKATTRSTFTAHISQLPTHPGDQS